MTKRLITLRLFSATIILLILPALPAGAANTTNAGSTVDRIEVRAPNYAFDPLASGEPALPATLRATHAGAGLRLVQFFGPTQDAWLAGLEASGLKVLQYYPHYTYLVWGSAAQAEAAQGLDFVRWSGAFHPAYKINSDLHGRHGPVENVDVMFYNDGAVDATIKALETLGAKVIQYQPSQPDKAFYNALVVLDAGRAADVARLDTVLWLGYSHPVPMLDDEMSSQIVAGNYSAAGVPSTGYQSWLTGLGFDGAGVRWATIDTGVDYTHPDLGSHIVAGYNFPGACVIAGQPGTDCPTAVGGHGTHVTGIIGGDATGAFADPEGFRYGLGIAPNYDIVAMNSLSASAWPPVGGWQEHTKQAVLMNAIGGNNSWYISSDGVNHGYQASERTHDLMVLDGNFDTAAVEPFIEVFSAGNLGPNANTLTAPKEAKNLIVVAASQNYRVGSIDAVASFSSRGPSVDGRIVPTITAPGQQIASTRSGNSPSLCGTPIAGASTLYSYCSGTSMAAPHASGSVVLIADWWRSFNAGANPSPAMAKALLVNGAVDMGAADIPNFSEGWGRVSLGNVIDNGVAMVYQESPVIFANTGEQVTLTVGVPDPTKPLKITVAWTDAAGAVGANPALVNNLDLTVVTGATTYKGNNFTGGWSVAGGAADARNNLENVYVRNPTGSATITINAANIAGDAVLGNADPTDQGFSLVCYNCESNPDYTLAAAPALLDICRPNNAQVAIAVGQIQGYNSPVTLSAVGNPAGTTATFSANPVIPPGASTLTIGNTGVAAPGNYTIAINGNASGNLHTTSIGLAVYSAAPAGPVLIAPANDANNVPETPTFTWNAVAQAASYSLEVATDAAFSAIVASASGLTSPAWTSNVSLNTGSTYYWRVRGANTCGVGINSSVFSFTTLVDPGDCAIGSATNTIYREGFEDGPGGWTSSGTGDAWAISATPAYVHSGTQAMHAAAPSSVSDQKLTSPLITLPAGQNPVTFRFWNFQTLEDRSGGCFDGGILEISADAGATWTQAPAASLLTDPYDGPVSANFDNPLSGLPAWCGDPQPYLNSIVDVSAYAGRTVQFRLRLGADSDVGRPDGWNIDDVVVQSCRASALSKRYLPAVRVGG